MILSIYAVNDEGLSRRQWEEYLRRIEVLAFFRSAVRCRADADGLLASVWVLEDFADQDFAELLAKLEETANEFGQTSPMVIGAPSKERRNP